jgi:hypothetical protein
MINNSISSLHLDSSGISEDINALHNPKNPTSTHNLLQLSPSTPNKSSSLSEKKMSLLKRLLLLQKETQMFNIGDPTMLLDENFDLSPKNYTKLLEYMKKTAGLLNKVVGQSSELFSNYLGLSDLSEHLKLQAALPNITHCQSFQSADSSSTRESDQTPKSSTKKNFESFTQSQSQKEKVKMAQIWESENDYTIIKLAKKYHKNWNLVAQAFSDHYYLNYKPEFLRARYNQLTKQEAMIQSTRRNLQNFELFEEKKDCFSYEGIKKIKNDYNSREELDSFELAPFDQFTPCESEPAISPVRISDGESFKLFFTKNEQLESKVLELPWITLDLNREFDQDNELFERVTSHN